MSDHPDVVRPKQLGLLLLASGESLPRQRARDQRPDLAGSRLKQHVLRRLIDLDPEPNDIVSALESIVVESGEPTGPTRAMAQVIAEEYIAIRDHPQLTAWLLDQATR